MVIIMGIIMFNGDINGNIFCQMRTMVLEYLPTKLGDFWTRANVGKYSSTMVRIWVVRIWVRDLYEDLIDLQIWTSRDIASYIYIYMIS